MMDINTILNHLEELKQKVTSLEESVKDLKGSTFHFQLDVKDLHLNELNFDELAFHLDKLDINDLSGMLNIGNNFSPAVHRNKKKKGTNQQQDTRKAEPKERSDIEIKVNGKILPFKST